MKTHWLSETKIYRVYRGILTRCRDKNSLAYKNYWWRWIKCEWNSFEDFYKDVKDIYKEWLTIDRIDNDWNYCKDNCRWATRKEQQKNKRNTIIYKKMSLSEWGIKNNLKLWTIHFRIKSWWDISDAVWDTIRKIWSKTYQWDKRRVKMVDWEEYESITEASRITWICISSIRSVCMWRYKKTKNWKKFIFLN